MNKKASMKPIFFVMVASMMLAFFWDSVPAIKETAHLILDPSIGGLLNWNLTWGMLIVIASISLLMTIIQKYGTDQKEIKRLKDEQKNIQQEMKALKDHPEKMMELQKSALPLTMDLMKHSMRPIVYTGIPLILMFRWFADYFSAIPDFRFFGFFSWLWFYFLGSIILGSFIRKFLKVV